jgi:hypothetical protein
MMEHQRVLRKRSLPTLPINLLAKYKGEHAVQFLHVLPAAFWSLLIPFQLNTKFRNEHGTAHRYSGYVFVALSLSITAGLGAIHQRGLYYHLTDFPSIPTEAHLSEFGFDRVNHVRFFLGVMAWFSFSMMVALYYAPQRKFSKHQEFIYRHVAAGIWVAVQRLYVFVRDSDTLEGQKAAFGDGAFIGVALTVLGAELAIYCTRASRKAKLKVA